MMSIRGAMGGRKMGTVVKSDTMFVDGCKDRDSAIKKARKKLRKEFPAGKFKRNIYSVHQQEYNKGRYVIWYKIWYIKRKK